MAGAAAAGLVLLPFVVDAIAGLLTGRWEDQLARLAGKAGPRPTGRPLEQLTADLRRLRAAVAKDGHRPAERQLADRMAYDRVLVELCEMLSIDHRLGSGIAGRERDLERFRLEAELERAGIDLVGPVTKP